MMKRLFASAALLTACLLASTPTQAQYTFEYGGRTIRIDPDRGTVSIPGVYDNTGRRRRSNSDRDHARRPAPDQAKVDPQVPAQAQTEQAPASPIAPGNTAPVPESTMPESTTANVAPADSTAPPAVNTPTPPIQQDAVHPTPPAPPPVVATAPPPPTPVQKQPAAVPEAATAPPPNSPLGLWLTEEKEGKVRIEQCGANLCGYSVDAKSNQNGEQVFINMQPGEDSKWSGRILDPNTGSTYDSTIAMKGSDSLRVQGCAFGGMFCGGQTWTRLN
jgi:uncharacterized protein (DUF2147 family)